jgi:hypothetical protein
MDALKWILSWREISLDYLSGDGDTTCFVLLKINIQLHLKQLVVLLDGIRFFLILGLGA